MDYLPHLSQGGEMEGLILCLWENVLEQFGAKETKKRMEKYIKGENNPKITKATIKAAKELKIDLDLE